MTHLERFGPILFFLAAILGTFAALVAEEIPHGLLPAILRVESESHIGSDGGVIVGTARDGRAGEVGVSQLSPVVCRQWGFSRSRLRTDTAYALWATRLHLLWLRRHTHSWDEAVRAYNGGLSGRNRPAAIAYARRIKAAEGN